MRTVRNGELRLGLVVIEITGHGHADTQRRSISIAIMRFIEFNHLSFEL